MEIQDLIARFAMQPLPEGGWFSQGYISPELLAREQLPERYREDKPFGTAILYLISAENFSALHRLPTDEIYHFYLGDPVEMLLIDTSGAAQRVTLGPDVLNGQQVQFVAPRGAWQGSRVQPGGQFALLGTTMAPGFTPTDYEEARREELISQFPHLEPEIRALTRI
ncbi:MAG TPA: cupin domain-containing protein [Anaerolineaceae bacterium]